MDWPASDASVYAMIPFRKLRRSVSTENGDISRDHNADTTPTDVYSSVIACQKTLDGVIRGRYPPPARSSSPWVDRIS